MSNIFQIEDIIDQLFDEVCPTVGPEQRALKPLLAPVLGMLMPNSNSRKLVSNRDYNRVDFADFADYATSPLPPKFLLGNYIDDRALIFEGIDRRPEEPLFTTTWSGREFGLSILDAIVARSKVFVSVTTRLLVYRNPLATYRQQYGDLDPDDIAGATVLTTVVFAAQPLPRATIPAHEAQPLEEWDRYYIMPPVPEDLDWRFSLSGTYTDSLLDDFAQHPDWPGSSTADQINKVRSGRHANEKLHAVEFELGILALALPHYVRFMYDLIVNEKFPRPQAHASRKHSKARAGNSGGLKYRLIKSVRVIRPDSSQEQELRRTWSPAAHPFAVRGHWRTFSDSNRIGHDESGGPIRGRTWVREHKKGSGGPFPFPTSTESRSSSVTINIKQALSYGRDLLESQESESRRDGGARIREQPSNKAAHESRNGPSLEWRVQERAKLTSGLRYFILRRDGFRCQICGRSAADESNVRLEVDHKIPIADWGKTIEANLWTLCSLCNGGKGPRPIGQK